MSIIKRALSGETIPGIDTAPKPHPRSPIVACSGCHAPIIWGITPAGKRMPLDAAWIPTPVPGDAHGYYVVDGSIRDASGYRVQARDGGGLPIRPHEPLFDAPGTAVHMNHWATCSKAEEFKK